MSAELILKAEKIVLSGNYKEIDACYVQNIECLSNMNYNMKFSENLLILIIFNSYNFNKFDCFRYLMRRLDKDCSNKFKIFYCVLLFLIMNDSSFFGFNKREISGNKIRYIICLLDNCPVDVGIKLLDKVLNLKINMDVDVFNFFLILSRRTK